VRTLFRGPLSLTYRGERLAFYLTLLFAFPAAGAIGYVLREDVHYSQIAVLGVIAMVYVTLSRGRLVGSSVRIHESQYPRVFAIVSRCAAALDLPMPMIFVRDDPFVPIVTVGLGDPYSLVLSSNWIEHFQDDELSFMVGRELGHIASGHARFTSLLSVNGNENAIVSLIFGSWLRRTELTSDRVGLLCCGSLDAAMRAIIIASFHAFGRKIDHRIFAEQGRDIHADSVLRLGEFLGSMPYATRRIESMQEFFETELYRVHEERFVNQGAEQPVVLPEATGARVEKRDLAGWWRRFSAAFIDVIIVQALVTTLFIGVGAPGREGAAHVPAAGVSSSDQIFAIGALNVRTGGVVLGKNDAVSWRGVRAAAAGTLMPVEIAIYLALFVGLTGQTPGMLIVGLKVVRTDFGKPAFGQALLRYLFGLIFSPFIVMLSPFSRLYLHDRMSGTRLIKTERVLARVAAG
jgi:Zn-dependent protease with chaperone function/uncharacterized RDD family membrane protein YckC